MSLYKTLLAGLVLLCMAMVAHAAKIPAGTVITAQNIDKYYNDTLDGHKLKNLLTKRMEWMIRKKGFEPKLEPHSHVKMDPAWVKATKKYVGHAKYHPKSRTVTGYVAGVPFPNVKPSDKYFAIKQMYNYYYGAPHSDYQNYPLFTFLLIDGNSGLDRDLKFTFKRYFLKGLLHYKGGHTRGNGKNLYKLLLFADAPRDIKGLGTFTIFHDGGALPSIWAYVPAVRRIRQLSSGGWMDPIAGTDMLNSDIEILNINPKWFPKYKYIGQRWILASVKADWGWDPSKSGPVQTYPGVDLTDPPHWMPVSTFQPRKVWVIDAFPPNAHPYGRIRLYMEQAYPRFNMADVYDKNGDFWKEELYTTKVIHGPDNSSAVVSATGFTMDWKKNHTTVFLLRPDVKINTQGVSPEDLNLGVLRTSH
jgi:hypothetical protein